MADVNVIKFATQWPNYLYILTAIISGTMLILPAIRRGASGSALTVQEATLLINREDAQVLDVRDQEEFQKGHILHARSVPMAHLQAGAGELQRFKTKPVIIACENGNRSGNAASMLRKQGFEKVFTLTGGLAAWKQAGLPVEKK